MKISGCMYAKATGPTIVPIELLNFGKSEPQETIITVFLCVYARDNFKGPSPLKAYIKYR